MLDNPLFSVGGGQQSWLAFVAPKLKFTGSNLVGYAKLPPFRIKLRTLGGSRGEGGRPIQSLATLLVASLSTEKNDNVAADKKIAG